MGRILVGTASWTDKTLLESGWYPDDVTTARQRLAYYAEQFPLVEVDSTYYAPPAESTVALWRDRTPPGFTFNIKAFSLLTQHPTRPAALYKDLRERLGEPKKNLYLRDVDPVVVEQVWDRFLAALEPLHEAGKLGAILFQFPQWFPIGRNNKHYLLECHARCAPMRICVEFRNHTWMSEENRAETLDFLTSYGLPYVSVDMPQGYPGSIPPVLAATADLAVVRFHGHSDKWTSKDVHERFGYLYSDQELHEWAPKLRRLAEDAATTHVLMNNCYRDYAQRNAAQLARLLHATTATAKRSGDHPPVREPENDVARSATMHDVHVYRHAADQTATNRDPVMTTSSEQTETAATKESPTAMRRLLSADMVERTGCPFDPPPGLRRRRDLGPVQPLKLRNGAPAWLVTGFDEARAVLGDPRFSADRMRYRDATQLQPHEVEAMTEGGAPAFSPTPVEARTDGLFVFMDPPEHTRLRRLLTGQFTVRRMRALESRVTEIAVEHIEAMRAAGTEADLVPAYALPLPSLVICELLGVDYADRAEFQERTAISLNANAGDEDRARAGAELYAFIAELVAAKRAKPADDLLSGLAHDADPPLTDAQLIDMALVLLGAGHETTANMLGLGAFALLEHPDQLAALRADPALLDNAVEELLRYLSIIQLGVTRVATEDITLAGVDIPAGGTVIIATPEVNRDPRHWTDPDRLDVTRTRNSHLAFGHGIHQCLGQQLARVEMRVGLGELFSRLPGLRLAVPAEEVPLRDEMLIFGVHSLPVTWD